MRILFGATPAFGHLLPMVPLLRAARAAGHDVALLTSSGMQPIVSAQIGDVPLLRAGPMPDELFAEVHRRTGLVPAADPRPEAMAEFFAGTRVDLSLDEALSSARRWLPDIVVAEPCDLVAPLVAAALHLPLLTHAVGPALPEVFTSAMAATVRLRYEARGLRPVTPKGYIDPAPAALQEPGWMPDTAWLPVRPEAHHAPTGSWTLPAFEGIEYRLAVLVTLGTVVSGQDLLHAVVDSLDTSSTNTIASVGAVPGTPIPAGTDNLRYVPFVPLGELLDGQDVVVSAGGAGTVLAALSRGIPLVLLPQGADQSLNAARVAAAGAGIVVETPGEVGAAVSRFMHDFSYLRAARRVADEIAAMPTTSDVVAALEVVVATGRIGSRSSNRPSVV